MVTDEGVQYQDVGSSNLKSVGYDADNENLFIVFIGGRKYAYYHVPARVYAELMAAESKGKYHAAHVKNAFSYDRIS